MGSWSHIEKVAGTKGVGAGPNGAEVLVIDAEGFIVQPKSHTSNSLSAPGTASRIPANPAGYLSIKIGGEVFKVPFFKA